MMNEYASKVIDALGGTVAVSKLCNVTTGAVSQWRQGGIPEARLMYLKILKPSIFKSIKEEHIQD